jgi:hypothetical protein
MYFRNRRSARGRFHLQQPEKFAHVSLAASHRLQFSRATTFADATPIFFS